MRVASRSLPELHRLIAVVLMVAGLRLAAFGATDSPPAGLNSTEALLVGGWQGDLLTDLAHAWPHGDEVPLGQIFREVIELRADRTVVVHPRCADHHDQMVVYFQALQLRWSVTPDGVLHWHSEPVASDLLGGTTPLTIEGATLKLPAGPGKELVLTRYVGDLPPPACQFGHD